MKKKIFGITLAVCLIVVSLIGTTVAYFTDTDADSKVFTAGNVDIELNGFFDTTITGSVFPAQTITSSSATISNIGSEDAFVGAVITISHETKDVSAQINSLDTVKTLFSGLGGDNFELQYIDNDKTVQVFVLYTQKLDKKVGETVKDVTLFNGITIPALWGNDAMQIFSAPGLTIKVDAYATQTYSFANAEAALEAAFSSVWGSFTADQAVNS